MARRSLSVVASRQRNKIMDITALYDAAGRSLSGSAQAGTLLSPTYLVDAQVTGTLSAAP